MESKTCAIVPVYRHGKTLAGVVEGLSRAGLPVIVVDDGNDAKTKDDIRLARERLGFADLVVLPENRGKGGAVCAGFLRAAELGFTHAFQIDADGQHDMEPIARFLEESRKAPDLLVCGYPVFDESVPSSRKNGRKVTNFWVAAETLSADLKDSMCGFRLYPLAPTCRVVRKWRHGQRMTFDIEILIRLYWRGVPTRFLPIKVRYPEGGISNFRMVRDNIEISLMHARLFFGMLPRLPLLLARKAVKHGR